MHRTPWLLPILGFMFLATTFARGNNPPLGIADMASLLASAEHILPDSPTTLTLSRLKPVISRLDSVRLYCDQIAAAEIGQIPYRWFTIGRKRVSPNIIDVDRYSSQVAIYNAMALRLQPIRADIFVLNAEIIEANGQTTHIALNQMIRADLPKRPIIYFTRPHNIQVVYLAMHQETDLNPRMILQIGVPQRPEYAREISGLCAEAESFLRQGNIEAARISIAQARKKLATYRQFLRQTSPDVR